VNELANLGRMVSRECGRMFERHCEERSDEAIQSRMWSAGLFRFARNDGAVGCLKFE
jgi:hypothetical protein